MTRSLIDDCWASRSKLFSVEHGHPLLLDQFGSFVDQWTPQHRILQTALFNHCGSEEHSTLCATHLVLQGYLSVNSSGSTIIASPGHGRRSTSRARLEALRYRKKGWESRKVGATACYVKNCLTKDIAPHLDFTASQGSSCLVVASKLASGSRFFEHASATMSYAAVAYKIVLSLDLALWIQKSGISILYVSRDRKGNFETIILSSE